MSQNDFTSIPLAIRRQVCASALSDSSQLATACAAFKASAALLQIVVEEQEQLAFHALLPQMLHVRLSNKNMRFEEHVWLIESVAGIPGFY